MERTDFLKAATAALVDRAEEAATLLRSRPDLSVPLGGGSLWTARDTAAHLAIGPRLYAEIANGVPSPARDAASTDFAKYGEALLAEVTETDPDRLADLILEGVDRFVSATAGRPGEDLAPWHFGVDLDIAALAAILVSEYCLHGYEIATAVGMPWRIEPGHALIALGAAAPLLGMILSPAAAGHTAAYGLALRGGPSMTARFADGTLTIEEPGAPVDCEISADPAAFLLTFANRMPRWPAFTLGLITASGPRPELAHGFQDLFVFP